MKRAGVYLLAVALLVAAAAVQLAVGSRRPNQSPAIAEGALAALGGLRSIAAEIVWFRADRLQEEGRYVELAQLASLLTRMEPHTPEVWGYAAWNLSFNISVMMATPEDRWRWVHSAVKLLRDDGLKLNPRSAELYRELAWLFELKLGTDVDSAAPVYREKWKAIVEDVKKRGAWHELSMDTEKMRRIEKLSGLDDWTDPLLSAIYWAMEGLRFAKGNDRAFLSNIIRQSDAIYRRRHGISKKEEKK
jgi:hypothetical protein